MRAYSIAFCDATNFGKARVNVMSKYGRIGGALCSLVVLILSYTVGMMPCSAEDPQSVTGDYYDGDYPPPGSIVAREQGGANHIGYVNLNGGIDDIIPRSDDHPEAVRFNIPYSQWKTEDGSVGKGAWVPNNLTLDQINQVCQRVRENLQNAQDFELYPNNRGPDYYNCLGVPIKAYTDCNLLLPITDDPTLTPTELWHTLTGVEMHGLQSFDAEYGDETVTYTFDMLTQEEREFIIQLQVARDIAGELERFVNQLLRSGWAGSSGGGGVESRPLWLGQSKDGGILASFSSSSSSLLEQFLPLTGPRGESRVQVEPRDVMGGSNAVAATGMDYQSAPGVVEASIFGAETLNSIYEHDYPVCTRVRLSEIDAVMPILYNGHWWWTIRAHNEAENCDELALSLSIIVNGYQAVVDSRYLVENYPTGIIGTVLNYQIRAKEVCDALYYLEEILDQLAIVYSISFSNTIQPASPTVFAHTAVYENGIIRLHVENMGNAVMTRFSGPVWTEPRGGAQTQVEFNLQVAAGESDVDLPVGPIHDAVIYIQAGNFTDKVYVAAGYWFAWDDQASGGTSEVAMTTMGLQHATLPGAASWFVSPPQAEMTGVVTDVLSWGHVGIGYSFRQAAQPIDISAADSVAFWMKGDGKQYRVKLESASVMDNDFHGATFTASTDWQVIRIPFSAFAQEGWGQPVAWTGRDIRTISFVTVGRPHASVHLWVDRISFLQSGAKTDLIGRAKLGDDGSDAAIFGGVVTAVFGDSFYIEAIDRSSAIQVHKAGHTLSEGAKIDLGGIFHANPDGECYIEASSIANDGTASIRPLGMPGKLLGGKQAGLQSGIPNTVCINNIALLVRTFGKFEKTSDTTFTLDDGSGFKLKCTVPSGVVLDPLWNHAIVTGISSCEKVGEELHRLLRVRSREDIIPL